MIEKSYYIVICMGFLENKMLFSMDVVLKIMNKRVE